MALETLLTAALDRLPAGIVTASAESAADADADDEADDRAPAPRRTAPRSRKAPTCSATSDRLMQIVDGEARVVAIKSGKGSSGILARDAKIIRALLPIRDAVRDVLRAQAADQPWAAAQIRLRIAYSNFVRGFGPINHTVVSVTADAETGEERETHRRPNLAPFADDPDCWLVASIEDYDLESGLARMGPIFRERVIAPPAAPLIATAADALAVTLNETGRVDIDHLAELLDRDPETALAQLGEAVFRNPATEAWETDDAYLSGSVRTKLALAEAAAERDPQYARNVAALRRVQPEDLRPSDITARLGAPWIPAADIEAFAAEVMGTATRGAPHRRDRVLVRGCRALRLHRRRHLRMGHRAAQRRLAAERCAEQRHAADLRHRHRGRRREARAQQRGDRGRQGEAGEDQGRLHRLDLDRSRPHRPAGAHLQRPFQQPGAAPVRRPAPDPARRQQHHPPLRPPEAGDLAHRRRRLDLHRPRRRRREILRHRRARSWSRSGSA